MRPADATCAMPTKTCSLYNDKANVKKFNISSTNSSSKRTHIRVIGRITRRAMTIAPVATSDTTAIINSITYNTTSLIKLMKLANIALLFRVLQPSIHRQSSL